MTRRGRALALAALLAGAGFATESRADLDPAAAAKLLMRAGYETLGLKQLMGNLSFDDALKRLGDVVTEAKDLPAKLVQELGAQATQVIGQVKNRLLTPLGNLLTQGVDKVVQSLAQGLPGAVQKLAD